MKQGQRLRLVRILLFCAILCFIDVFFTGLPVFGVSLAVAGLFMNLFRSIRLLRSSGGESSWHASRALVFGLTILAILATFSYNRKTGRENAERIVAAVREYQDARGLYPEKLAELVPAYLPAVPVSAYRLMHTGYTYLNRDGQKVLIWVDVPPYGRGVYDFESGQWSYRD